MAVLWFIFTTPVCNLNCRYCGGSIPEEVMPHEIKYDFENLRKFIEKDPEADIAFYGGEPLLKMDYMERIMREIPTRNFFLQTNGIFLHLLKPDMLKKMHTILVSLDGPEEITDYYRGKGVYKAALKNAELIRKKGFEGDLIARMAVSQESDIYRDVMHLLSLWPFDHVHWQLNVVWDPDDSWKDFRQWLKDSYYPGLERLADFWVESIEKRGAVPGIVPFQGIVKRLMGLEKPGLPCGSGRDAFAVATDGEILACPIGGEFEWNHLGNISTHSPETIERVFPDEPCPSCPYYDVCGGRCLFANKERLWGDDGFNLICETVKYTIDLMKERLPRIENAISEGVIDRDAFLYPEVNNTTEIIP